MVRVLLFVFTIGIQLYGLIDCAQREDGDVRSLPRWGWLIIIILVPTLGAVAYLIAGRPKRPGNGGRKPKRSIAPDDDPDFLRGL
ncbi:MAG: PLD nuclease N-terminal domain-containing protein [Actinobacteria bacterium]|nr:PLD nuclease N-terminal domain-containing protein [Actinomycetota bacterium]